MLKLISRQWKYLLAGIIVVDLLIFGLIFYVFLAPNSIALSASLPHRETTPKVIQVIVTATPWPGPPPRPSTTATAPPTPLATDVLAQSGFPPGFTPTPRPTREPQVISLPYIFPAGRRGVDSPVINQINYPEPFFPAGTNNACGPIALFAGLLGLGFDVNYQHLRDVAVNYGFTSYGISKQALVGTASTLNSEWGYPLTIEHGNYYNTKDLIQQIGRGGVVIVLVRVKRINGKYQVTTDLDGSIGHFLVVERINLRTKKVKLAGSTLGMDQVPLADFVKSWGSNPQAVASGGWRSFIKKEEAVNWALILKRKR